MAQDFAELDVRPLLANGVEPFPQIMSAVEALSPQQGLRLLAPFRPEPLFNVMRRRGFSHQVRELGGGDYEVCFLPAAASVAHSQDAASADIWPEAVLELDLTDLDPPQPMVRILAELEGMQPGEVLFALLSREPVFLFPELQRRGHQWVGSHDETGTVFRMLVRRGEGNRDV